MARPRASSPSNGDAPHVIFGLDHITLGGAITRDREAFLQELGYQPALRAEHLGNLVIKQPWLTAYGDTHALALFRAPQAAGVEIVDHYATHGRADRLMPVLHGDAPMYATDQLLDDVAGGRVWWSPTIEAGYVLRSGAAAPICDFVWRSVSPEASAEFWRLFGFTPEPADQPTDRKFRFRGVDGVACSLTLVAAAPSTSLPTTRLDAAGFTCFAFVTTSVDRDVEDLQARGLKTSAVASITPGDRPLHVAFVEGPDGEVVELIGSK